MSLGEVIVTDGESGFELGRHFPSDKEYMKTSNKKPSTPQGVLSQDNRTTV